MTTAIDPLRHEDGTYHVAHITEAEAINLVETVLGGVWLRGNITNVTTSTPRHPLAELVIEASRFDDTDLDAFFDYITNTTRKNGRMIDLTNGHDLGPATSLRTFGGS